VEKTLDKPHAVVAQLVERLTVNQQVTGSNPVDGAFHFSNRIESDRKNVKLDEFHEHKPASQGIRHNQQS
jgi:hypothetical protein